MKRIDEVQFPFNTLAAALCLPASGRTVTLRQEYDVNLSVDCIGKALLSVVDHSDCECFFNLDIPNGIDVILCLQEVVSILRSEQIVVLASPTAVQPRVVDTFECFFNLDIPNGIDVILCLQEVVSILRSEQIVVLASPTAVQPRVVDTFANVCDFNQCGEDRDRDRDRDNCNTCKR